jgi:cephalosporin hydroxylase
MAPIAKVTSRFARWMLGLSDTGLQPHVIDSIQRGALAYKYKGRPMLKDPFDLALYALLIQRERPRTVIEIGTYKGGATTWFADQLSTHGIDGKVYSLDVVPTDIPASPGIAFLTGSARELSAVFPADWLSERPRPLLVIDDGDHTRESVLAVLKHFGPMMRPGEYVVIEDGSADDLGLAHKMGGGPLAAIREFLAAGAPFEIDRRYCDFFGRNMTWNVDGYLRRL